MRVEVMRKRKNKRINTEIEIQGGGHQSERDGREGEGGQRYRYRN